jgi:mRNA interferase YafQ
MKKRLYLKYKDHPLSGKYKKYRNCHIEPDWVLIYEINDKELSLIRLGSHSELFG